MSLENYNTKKNDTEYAKRFDEYGIINRNITEQVENKLLHMGYSKKFLKINEAEKLNDLANRKVYPKEYREVLDKERRKDEIAYDKSLSEQSDKIPVEKNNYDDFFEPQEINKGNKNHHFESENKELSYKEDKTPMDNNIFKDVGLYGEFPKEYLHPISKVEKLSDLFSPDLEQADEKGNHVFVETEHIIDEKKLEKDNLKNPIYNKVLNQLEWLEGHLENEGAREALKNITELFKNEPYFLEIIKKFQRESTISKSFYITEKPYSAKSMFVTLLTGVYAGGFSLFGQVFAGLKGEQVVYNSMAAIIAMAMIMYARTSYKYEKSKKNDNAIMRSLDGINSLFNKELISYLMFHPSV